MICNPQAASMAPKNHWQTGLRFAALGLVVALLGGCGGSVPPRTISTNDPGLLTEADPLESHQILEHNPLTHASSIYQTDDEQFFVAHWSASAGRFTWDYTDIVEAITILEGEAFVKTSDGKTHHLTPGSTMVFGSGEFAEWNVPNYIRKVAVVQRTPRPFLRRVTDKIGKIVGS